MVSNKNTVLKTFPFAYCGKALNGKIYLVLDDVECDPGPDIIGKGVTPNSAWKNAVENINRNRMV